MLIQVDRSNPTIEEAINVCGDASDEEKTSAVKP
jgi:hypothetical protein